MKLYLASSSCSDVDMIAEASGNILLPFLNQKTIEYAIKYPNISLMVDSSAFSAWTKGIYIDIQKYIEFCIHIKACALCKCFFINLDVIPGSYGSKPRIQDVQSAAEKGWQNWNLMRKSLPETIHVFHQHEHFDWLARLYDSGATYIGISPANDVSLQKKCLWLDKVFAFCYKYNMTNLKTHCFGSTSPLILRKFPFYSADSTHWLSGPKYGFVLQYSKGRFNAVKAIRSASRKARLIASRNAHLELEKFLTNLWIKRGVIWHD